MIPWNPFYFISFFLCRLLCFSGKGRSITHANLSHQYSWYSHGQENNGIPKWWYLSTQMLVMFDGIFLWSILAVYIARVRVSCFWRGLCLSAGAPVGFLAPSEWDKDEVSMEDENMSRMRGRWDIYGGQTWEGWERWGMYGGLWRCDRHYRWVCALTAMP